MQYFSDMIESYLSQLEKSAESQGVKLLEAFKSAGIPDSTFYRARKRNGDIRLAVARRVEEEIFYGTDAP